MLNETENKNQENNSKRKKILEILLISNHKMHLLSFKQILINPIPYIFHCML